MNDLKIIGVSNDNFNLLIVISDWHAYFTADFNETEDSVASSFVIASFNMSRIMRKPAFRSCENKGADQLRSNCEADHCLCFRYSDSTISLLLKPKISSF